MARATVAAASLIACSNPGKQRGQEAQALFEDRCKNVAGHKIYRQIDNVEGILLLKVRPRQSENEWRDKNYPGAAFAREAPGDEYITSFLAYEHSWSSDGKVSPTFRGYISTGFSSGNPVNLRGYRFVDVIDPKDGVRYRYTGRWEEPWQYDKTYLKGYIKFFLDKHPAKESSPRYGVTYEDHVIPQERALGLASSTVKVLDLQTNEALGEFTSYSKGGGFGQVSAQNNPWLSAYTCGAQPHSSAHYLTRQFVDQVLRPKQGD